jgi:hypothetical protein
MGEEAMSDWVEYDSYGNLRAAHGSCINSEAEEGYWSVGGYRAPCRIDIPWGPAGPFFAWKVNASDAAKFRRRCTMIARLDAWQMEKRR